MIIFRKARSPRQTLNDLDAYIKQIGDEPVEWLAREVQKWGEFSYSELESVILDGRLNDLIDWQARYAEVVNDTLAPMWAAAMTAAAKKATQGKIILDDSDVLVKAWIQTHGGELITLLSAESRRAVAAIILRGQAERILPRDMAKQVRPLIGLTEQQAQANVNYREKVYQRYIEGGASSVTAAARADKAALKYAGQQHRYRAETIVHTELAYAYNRGAHMGVSQAISERLMGRCEMVWSTAGTNRVCSRCLALKDTVVGHTDESGVTLPPLHPRCRCAIMYREVEKPKPQQSARQNTLPTSPLAPADAAVATEIISPPPKPTNEPQNELNFDPQLFNDEKIKLEINGFGEAHIPMAKLTKYALNPEKSPDKAAAFEKALGYDLNNIDKLIENIKSNVNNYKMEEKPDLGYGKRFQQIIEITGENGKTANVLLAWILDKNTGEFRLTSIYVDKK